jgi:hypothetical protein
MLPTAAAAGHHPHLGAPSLAVLRRHLLQQVPRQPLALAPLL